MRARPQMVLSCGFCDESLTMEPASQVLVPEFCITTVTGLVWPCTICAGTVCETNVAPSPGERTVTDTLGVTSPNISMAS